MSTPRFWVNCKAQGIDITMDQAQDLRDKWISTFKEMKLHMQPEELPSTRLSMQFGFAAPGSVPLKAASYEGGEEEDEDDDSQGDSRLFVSRMVNGMVRNRCSYCAALNTQFQGLTAFGVKNAMWRLSMIGLLPRLVGMVHDEVIYCLYPEELRTMIPIIEQEMIEGMRLATPHVKVGVGTSIMLHWDKGALEYPDIEWDSDGRPLLEEPEFVKEVYRQTSQQ